MIDECLSCHVPFQQHLGVEGTCQQLQNAKQELAETQNKLNCTLDREKIVLRENDYLMGQRDFKISEIERLEKVNLELIKDLEFRRELYKVLQTRSDVIEQERDEARAAIHPPCPQCGGSGKYAIETQSAAIIVKLREYNLWRRGSDQLAQPNPTDIGLYIDIICDIVERLERERDELRADQSNHEDMTMRYMDEVEALEQQLTAALRERDETREECLEQARLLGKGGEREASLLSQVEELKTKLKQYNT
jgi:chromosome segregation ATPase